MNLQQSINVFSLKVQARALKAHTTIYFELPERSRCSSASRDEPMFPPELYTTYTVTIYDVLT